MGRLNAFWFTKSKAFMLFIFIASAWRLNTILQVKYFDQRLFLNIRAFISSKYKTTNSKFLRETNVVTSMLVTDLDVGDTFGMLVTSHFTNIKS